MEVEEIAELPAESNPLTESLLIHALQGALTGDNQRLITSKQQFEEWADKKAYYPQLEVRPRGPVQHGRFHVVQLPYRVNN